MARARRRHTEARVRGGGGGWGQAAGCSEQACLGQARAVPRCRPAATAYFPGRQRGSSRRGPLGRAGGKAGRARHSSGPQGPRYAPRTPSAAARSAGGVCRSSPSRPCPPSSKSHRPIASSRQKRMPRGVAARRYGGTEVQRHSMAWRYVNLIQSTAVVEKGGGTAARDACLLVPPPSFSSPCRRGPLSSAWLAFSLLSAAASARPAARVPSPSCPSSPSLHHIGTENRKPRIFRRSAALPARGARKTGIDCPAEHGGVAGLPTPRSAGAPGRPTVVWT